MAPRSRFPLAFLLAPSLLLACGGKTPPGATPVASASASTENRPEATPPPPPSSLPPMQPLPPPGVRGSDSAKVEEIDALYTCQANAPRTGKDPKGDAAKLAAACAKTAGTWTKVLAQTVTQSDGDGAAKIPFNAEAGRCYRVYHARDAAISAANFTIRDAAGKDAVDEGGAAAPKAGRLCFSASGAATLLVAVGAGRGALAFELWSTAK